MAEAFDQAEGLRRLFARDMVRSVAVGAGRPGAGCSSIAVNLAVDLARRGHRVLLLDETGGDRAASLLGVRPQRPLDDALSGARLQQCLVASPHGVTLAVVGKGGGFHGGWNALAGSLAERHDFLVVEAAAGTASPLGFAALDVVIAVNPSAQSITEAYAMIKRFNQQFGRRHFHIVVNRVPNRAAAEAIFSNLYRTARRFIDVALELCAWIPEDAMLARAMELKQPVVVSFPRSPAAEALRQFAQSVDEWPIPNAGSGTMQAFTERVVDGGRVALATPR